MKYQAYRFGRNSCRDENRRQSHRPYWVSKIKNDCCHSDRPGLSHNRSNFKKKSKTSGDCSQWRRNRGGW